MISKLKSSHAFSVDKIDAATLKLACESLAAPITFVINLSLGTEKWKLARVLPLLKFSESDKQRPASFWPVSRLPVISKLAERTVQVQLLEFLERTGQISTHHHAYRKDTSTTTALLEMMENISEGTYENKIIATMSIDSSATFDCVEHDMLLEKLSYYNLDKSVMNWLTSYLEYRSNFVAVGTGKSRIYNNTHGVPQGSCLGPLMYLVYVNEFAMIAKDDDCTNEAHNDTENIFGKECKTCGKIFIFADDAQYSTTS